MRFDVMGSPSLADPVRQRLMQLAGSRMSNEGVLVLTAQRFRSQERNKQDALERLAALIERAAHVPRPRRPTRPGKAAKARRMDAKGRRGTIKKLRGGVRGDGE